MNAVVHRLFGRFVWFVTGMASIGVALQAAGLDVLRLLYLCPISSLVLYGVGLCGVMSIILFFANCCTHCDLK